jgi:hypothetical protein
MQKRGYKQTLWNLEEMGRENVAKSVSIFNETRTEIPTL